jgi:sugar phosphate isomerase/epimerase
MIKRVQRISIIILYLLVSQQINSQEIALQLYSLRNELKTDPIKYHELISDWGIKYLEGGETYGLSSDAYKAMLHKNNLELVGIGADYEMLVKDLDAVKNKAKEFNVKYVTCYWIPHPEGAIDFDLLKEATETFNIAGKELNKDGITLLYHPHGYEFSAWEEGFALDYMLKNATYFDFCLDVYWIKMGGADPVKMMQSHPGKFPLLHMKDRQKGTADSKDGRSDVETNVVLGTGDVDISGIIKEAIKQKSDYLIIEDESSKSVKQIPLSLKYLQSKVE